VVGARAAAGTPCAEQAPVNLRLDRAESERGCTVKALVGFIGAGASVGVGSGVARRGARGAERRGVLWHCQGASNTWSFPSAQVLALVSSQTCESRHNTFVRSLLCT
jgi:hypothetical protein